MYISGNLSSFKAKSDSLRQVPELIILQILYLPDYTSEYIQE